MERLTCKGTVLVPVKLAPTIVNFQTIDADTTPVPQVVTIRRGDGGPLKLELDSVGRRGIEADITEVKPGEEYKLLVSVYPPQALGKLRTWVKLKTGVEEAPETTIRVYGEIPRGWSETELGPPVSSR